MIEEVKTEGPTRSPQAILDGLISEANQFIAEHPDLKKGCAGALFMVVRKEEGTQIGISMEIDGPPNMVIDLGVSLMERVIECADTATGGEKTLVTVLGILQEALRRKKERGGS